MIKDSKSLSPTLWKHYMASILIAIKTIILTGAYNFSEKFSSERYNCLDPYAFCILTTPIGILFTIIVINIFKLPKLTKINQRNSLILGDIFCIFGIYSLGAESLWLSFGGRILIGFAIGIDAQIVPIYLRESMTKGIKHIFGKIVAISSFAGFLGGIAIIFINSQNLKNYWKVYCAIIFSLSSLRVFWILNFLNNENSMERTTKENKHNLEIEKSFSKDKTKKGENKAEAIINNFVQQIKVSLVIISITKYAGLESLQEKFHILLIALLLNASSGLVLPKIFAEDITVLGCSLVETVNNLIIAVINFAFPLEAALSDLYYPNLIYVLGLFSLLNLLDIVTFQTKTLPVHKIFRTLNYLTKRSQKVKLNQQNQNVSSQSTTTPNTFAMTPIGYIENSCYPDKFGVPRQPKLSPHSRAILRLNPPFDHPDTVRGLETFSHVWITFIFHQSPERWTPLIRPPRLGGNAKVGVFASRSTHRPNRLGLSLVEIIKIDTEKGVCIHLKGHDLVEGTPILDIKPYLPWGDRAEDARAGFAPAPPEQLSVKFMPEAEKVLSERKDRDILEPLIREVMAQDPRPAYKSEDAERRFGVYLYDLDVRFRVIEENGEKVVKVVEIVKSHFSKE